MLSPSASLRLISRQKGSLRPLLALSPRVATAQLPGLRLSPSPSPSPASASASARSPLRSSLPASARSYSSAAPAAASPLATTPLYDLHLQHGAKMVPFAGFKMPLQYSDLSHVESHHWTREKASIFDVSHMVQHHLIGPGATDLLMKITPSSLHALKDNHATLSCLLHPETGGIIDDTVITRLGPDSFYFVTNAGRRAEDLEFLTEEINAFKAANGDNSLTWSILGTRAQIALQGPAAADALQPLITKNEASVDSDLSTLYFSQCRSLHLTFPDGSSSASRLLISRTGYTGEDGFEISIPTDADPNLPTRVVSLLLTNPNVKLAGLAARDSLRLEAGMCLYGNDITIDKTPPTAALGWLVGKDRRDPASPLSKFNGSSVILPQLASPSKTLKERRVSLFVDPGSAARAGTPIVSLEDPSVQVGVVTSGLPSPTLNGQNIAMGYVKQGLHKKGTELGCLIRKKVRKAVINSPFVPSKFYRG